MRDKIQVCNCGKSSGEFNIRKDLSSHSNLAHTFDSQNKYLDKDGLWSGIVAAECSTYHTALYSTPVQLVFGHKMILINPFISDGKSIRRHKQKLM